VKFAILSGPIRKLKYDSFYYINRMAAKKKGSKSAKKAKAGTKSKK
jgi:hypothetical protein